MDLHPTHADFSSMGLTNESMGLSNESINLNSAGFNSAQKSSHTKPSFLEVWTDLRETVIKNHNSAQRPGPSNESMNLNSGFNSTQRSDLRESVIKNHQNNLFKNEKLHGKQKRPVIQYHTKGERALFQVKNLRGELLESREMSIQKFDELRNQLLVLSEKSIMLENQTLDLHNRLSVFENAK